MLDESFAFNLIAMSNVSVICSWLVNQKYAACVLCLFQLALYYSHRQF